MPVEYEKRFRIPNYELLIKDIERFGAVFKDRKYLVDRIFTSKNKYVRLRSDGKHTYLTVKDKARKAGGYDQEYETTVGSIDTMEAIFTLLGIQHCYTNEKIRETWVKGDISFDIDHHPGMDPYLEIEAKDERTLIKTYKKLKLTPDDNINIKTGYKEIYGFILKKSLKYLGFKRFNVDAITKNKKRFVSILKFQKNLIKQISL